MYCSKCGKEIAEDTKFCNHCGSAQDQAQSNMSNGSDGAQNNSQAVSDGKKPEKGMRNGGIAMLVCGILAFIGSVSNGTLPAIIKYGPVPDDYITLAFMAGLIIGGIVLINKSKKR